MRLAASIFGFWALTATLAPADAPTAAASGDPGAPAVSAPLARVATLDPADLNDFDAQPPAVQRLLADALSLTRLGLHYRYGSDDPALGGMDCSGTIYCLLRRAGLAQVPRDASGMYRWVWTEGRVLPVISSSPDTFELARLKPGDLLFWSGTYRVTRDPPVTHVMIYLGVNRATGRRVMMGASEGRRFNDISRNGVSVFDFVLPRPASVQDSAGDTGARFIGYGSIPGLIAASGAALHRRRRVGTPVSCRRTHRTPVPSFGWFGPITASFRDRTSSRRLRQKD